MKPNGYIVATPKRVIKYGDKYKTIGFPILNATLGSDLKFDGLKIYESIEVDETTKHNILNKGRMHHHDIDNLNSVGCSLSHYRLWKICIETNVPLVCWEDDVEYNYFSNRNNMWSIINDFYDKYGDNSIFYLHSIFHHHRKNPFWKLFNIFRFDGIVEKNWTMWKHTNDLECFGTQAYIVTPKVARILMDNFSPIKTHVDYYIGQMVVKHKINLGFIHWNYLREIPGQLSTSNYSLYSSPLIETINKKSRKKTLLLFVYKVILATISYIVTCFKLFIYKITNG